MKLYHGTSIQAAYRIRDEGLRPRGRRIGNWKYNPSKKNAVYLTRLYAGYFAFCASKGSWGLIEVETDLLDPDLLRPDEDFLGQVYMQQNPHANLEEVTKEFVKHLDDYSNVWEDSVRFLGNCAYLDSIPPSAITRISIFNPKSNSYIAMANLDPSISILNCQLMGSKYEALTRWLMGEKFDLDTWIQMFYMLPREVIGPILPLAEIEQSLNQRSGWFMIKEPHESEKIQNLY